MEGSQHYFLIVLGKTLMSSVEDFGLLGQKEGSGLRKRFLVRNELDRHLNLDWREWYFLVKQRIVYFLSC